MARANKYSSVNFNDIYEKKIPTSPPSSSSSFSSRLSNGGMLVLSRPSPKPNTSLATTPPPPSSKSPPSHSLSILSPENPPSPAKQQRENQQPSPVPKSDKFVPPHLRPGYVARDQTHAPPESLRPGGGYRPGSGHGSRVDGRPSSGGGYDRRMRVVRAPSGESDLVDLNRPRSGGFSPLF